MVCAPSRPAGCDTKATAGFTFIELLLAVAIIGIGMSLAFWSVAAQQQKSKLGRFAREFENRLRVARSLAASAGARLGDATNFNNTCSGDAEMTVTIDPATNSYRVPVGIGWTPEGLMTTECEVVDLAAESKGRLKVVTSDGSAVSFSFAPSGRLMSQTPSTWVKFVSLDEDGTPQDLHAHGYRVLSSGIICSAATAADLCSETPR